MANDADKRYYEHQVSKLENSPTIQIKLYGSNPSNGLGEHTNVMNLNDVSAQVLLNFIDEKFPQLKSQAQINFDALEWYKEKAESLARYANDRTKIEGAAAVLVELALDGGKRANAVQAEAPTTERYRDHGAECAAAKSSAPPPLVEPEPELSLRTYELLKDGLKTTGWPMDAFSYIEERLYVDEAEDIYNFMRWCAADWPARSFGDNNYQERYRQFEKSTTWI